MYVLSYVHMYSDFCVLFAELRNGRNNGRSQGLDGVRQTGIINGLKQRYVDGHERGYIAGQKCSCGERWTRCPVHGC